MKRKYLRLIAFILITNVFGISAQVHKALYVDKAGTMISLITEEEANTITHLTLVGRINAIDFKHLRDGFSNLAVLDISNVDIRIYAGKSGTHPDPFYVYSANCIPEYAFCRIIDDNIHGKPSLRQIILSEKTVSIKECAFGGCNNLYICQISKMKAPILLEDALSDAITAIFIPKGTKDQYNSKKRWENFAFIESEPVEVKIQISTQNSLKSEIQERGLQPSDIHFLTIEGKLDSDDIKLMSDNMPNLVSVDISNTTATVLPDFAFAQKKYMLRINLPKKLRTIGQRALSGCGRLSGTVTLPPDVTSIGYGAFMGCDSLQRVVVTGNKLTEVGDKLFGESNSRLVYTK